MADELGATADLIAKLWWKGREEGAAKALHQMEPVDRLVVMGAAFHAMLDGGVAVDAGRRFLDLLNGALLDAGGKRLFKYPEEWREPEGGADMPSGGVH